MSRNYLNSQEFRDHDASFNGRDWTPTDAADAADDARDREWWRDRSDEDRPHPATHHAHPDNRGL